ncbi:restriction endonuclease subunit S [Planktomarina sp.]|nr:restriction endonuclease subunit S [Planktomarina sp.]
MKAGWELKALGSLLEVKNGYAFDSKKFTPDAGTPLIRIRDIKEGKGTAINYNGEYNEEFICKQGDFLIGMDGEFGCHEWKGDPSLLNQRVCRLENFDSGLMSRFLFYGINKYLKEIEEVTGYTTVKHLSSKTIKTIEFPLPALEEQKRIVSILDEAFEGLDRARENAEANLKSARELFEVFTKTVFGRSGKGWMQCTIGDVITLQRGIDITKKDQRAGRVPVVSSGGVKSYHDTAHTEGPGVIVGRKGSIGSVHFIDEAYWPHDTTLWVRDFKGNEPELVYFLLIGIRLAELDTGTANPSLNRNLVHTVPISWPSVHLQPAIVKELADCRDASKTSQLQYTAKLQDISDLRQSLLQKAFAGELT